MSEDKYDAIVIGLGSMGSATCWRMAQRGARVLGIDRFEPPHRRGSHGGDSRIVRQAYFEHPDYVPLLQKAYRGWDELADVSGYTLFERTGLLYFGPAEHLLIAGTLESSRRYSVPVEKVSASDYPLFQVPRDYSCLMERDAGFVRPDLAIESMLHAARANGAELKTNEKVIAWNQSNGGMKVVTENGNYRARTLVIVSGAWGGQLIPQLNRHLTVTQQALVWVKPKNERDVALGVLPCWTLADEKYPGIFYGFPSLPTRRGGSGRGFKLAHHAAGLPVEDLDGEDPAVHEAVLDSIRDILDRYFPGRFESELRMESCRYTNSPDGDFMVDYLEPFSRDVIYALGFSGHGFKFAPAIGDVLARMALEGKRDSAVEFLSSKRLDLGEIA
jgi:sarcosine oxidase